MVHLGFEPGAAGWNAQTNPLSYCGTPVRDVRYSYVTRLIEVKMRINVGGKCLEVCHCDSSVANTYVQINPVINRFY